MLVTLLFGSLLLLHGAPSPAGPSSSSASSSASSAAAAVTRLPDSVFQIDPAALLNRTAGAARYHIAPAVWSERQCDRLVALLLSKRRYSQTLLLEVPRDLLVEPREGVSGLGLLDPTMAVRMLRRRLTGEAQLLQHPVDTPLWGTAAR